MHGGFPDVAETIAFDRTERIDAVIRHGAIVLAIQLKSRFDDPVRFFAGFALGIFFFRCDEVGCVKAKRHKRG